MPRPDGSDSSTRISVAPPKTTGGRLNRSGYLILGVAGLVVATAFAAVAELAGPGGATSAGGTGIPGGQGTSPAGIQGVPGTTETVTGAPSSSGAPTTSH